MAVLNKIRQRSVFLIIIIALALFSFVLADLFRSGGFTGQKNQTTIATVNDEDIEREDFARRVEGYQQNQRNMTTTQAVNAVWNGMLQESLVKQQIEKTGIEVGERQFNQLLEQFYAGNPNFTNEAGMFDRNKMEEYIANLKETSPQAYQQWLKMEEQVTQQAKNKIYYNMVRAGAGATLVEGEQAYKMESESVDLKFVMVPYTDVEKAEVSKEEIKSYMKEHKKRFESEASANIKYIFFEEKASASDEEEAKKKLENLVPDFNKSDNLDGYLSTNSEIANDTVYRFKSELNQNSADQLFNLEEGSTYGPYQEDGFWKYSKVTGVKQIPDSVKVRRILVSYQGSPIDRGDFTKTQEQAQELADSLAGVVKNSSENFAELAKEYSDDPRAASNSGDLGWVRYMQAPLMPEVKEFAYNNPVGSVEVIENQMGYSVVWVEDAKEKKRAVQVATLGREIIPSEKTTNDLYTETTRFQMDATDGKDFDELAKESSYEVKKVDGVKIMQERLNAELGNQRGIVQWAFNEEETKVGNVERFETPKGYVVVKLTKRSEKGMKSVEEASTEVTDIIRKEKQAEMIKKEIIGKSIDEIASMKNRRVQTASAVNLSNPTLPGATSEPEVVGAAFSLKAGETTEPVAGKKGVYVVELVSRNEAPQLDSYKVYADRETKNLSSKAVKRTQDALKSAADIEDNRADFY